MLWGTPPSSARSKMAPRRSAEQHGGRFLPSDARRSLRVPSMTPLCADDRFRLERWGCLFFSLVLRVDILERVVRIGICPGSGKLE